METMETIQVDNEQAITSTNTKAKTKTKGKHNPRQLPSGHWQIVFRDQRGVKHRETYAKQHEARIKLEERRRAVRERLYTAPKSIPKFEQVAGLWLENKRAVASKTGTPVKETTINHWKVHIDKHLVPSLKGYRLDRIDVNAIECARGTWSNKLSPKTVNKLLTTLVTIFNFAIRRGMGVNVNEASKVERMGIGSVEADSGEKEGMAVKPEHIYNVEELRRLLSATIPSVYQALIMTVALTGIMHGEALALKWGDVDLEVGKLIIRRNRPDINNEAGEPVFYVPKSKSGVREIPIPVELVAVLKKWKLSCPVSQWDLVFPKTNGKPLDRKTVHRSGLQPAIRRAKVKQLTIHDLRHTYGSMLIAQGTPVTEVCYYMGHANPQITLTIYSHWMPRTPTDSVSRFAESIFNHRGHLVDTSSENDRAETCEKTASA